jgi:hypothetical protein
LLLWHDFAGGKHRAGKQRPLVQSGFVGREQKFMSFGEMIIQRLLDSLQWQQLGGSQQCLKVAPNLAYPLMQLGFILHLLHKISCRGMIKNMLGRIPQQLCKIAKRIDVSET